MTRFAFCIALLIVAAWAAQKPPVPMLHWSSACFDIEKGPTSYCEGPDRQHVTCYRLLTTLKHCETVNGK